jgi:hypothetical protein
MKIKTNGYFQILTLATSLFLCSCGGTNNGNQQSSTDTSQQTAIREKAELERQQAAELEKEAKQKKAYATAITTCLAADSKTAIGNSNSPSEQSREMRQIDLSLCPNDFATAYVDHIHAWEDYARYKVDWDKLESDDNIKSTLLQSIIDDAFGSNAAPIKDAADAEQQLKEAMKSALEKIHTTYQDVEHVAVSYGGTLPQ